MSEFKPIASRLPSIASLARVALRTIALAVCFAYSLPIALAAAPSTPVAKKPNLLLIIADDHGGETLGIAGDPRQATKNIDRLAKEGVYFDHAFCNSPLCTPSRQSLITGKLPHAVGVTRLSTRLPDSVLTMGEWFSRQGYRTAAIGKMHFNSFSYHGFGERIDIQHWKRHLELEPPKDGDHRWPWRPFVDSPAVWLNANGKNSGVPIESMMSYYFASTAIQWMNGEKGVRPFALILSLYDPHAPFNFPRHWYTRNRASQFSAPALSDADLEEQPDVFRPLKPDQVRGIQASYYNSVSFMDSQVGRVIRGLDESNLGEDTLVVYLGDNGYMLGQHGRFEKHCLYEPAIRVPLILRWTGHLPAGERKIELVELADVLPTILSLMRLPAPPGIQGIDLQPLIRGTPDAPHHDVVFSEYCETEEAMVRSSRFKLIVGSGRRPRKDGYQRSSTKLGPYQKLFDLIDDPGETRDLSNNPNFDATRQALLDQMQQRLVTTWTNPEPIPAGLTQLETIHWCLIPRDR
jgi:choline-sulfatase